VTPTVGLGNGICCLHVSESEFHDTPGESPAVTTSATVTTSSTDRDTSESTRRLRVLIVDDDRDASDTLGFLVRQWGHDALIAYDPVEALELARRCEPDVALLDIGLPDIDGVELARRLTEQTPSRHVLMVAISGQANIEHQPRWHEEGLLFYLVKPVDPSLIEDLLNAHKAGLTARERTASPNVAPTP
jgi:DNA-binding response OmpR family regulator